MNNDDRIDKTEYKAAVQKEKAKLLRQVIFLTIFSAVISVSFYMGLYFHTPTAI